MFKNKKLKAKLLVLFLVFTFIATSGLGCSNSVSQEALNANKPVTLKFWRTWDDQSDFQDIINAYKAIHPNVNIEYRRFRYEEYEQALLEAFAEDRGPDIFSIHDTWVNKYRSKLTPAPASVILPFPKKVKQLGIKEETTIDMLTQKLPTIAQVKNDFLDVVYNDVVWPDPSDGKSKVYALPVSVDTMVLYYNRDLLNAAGIPEPAQNWSEFQSHVRRLVKQDKKGSIVQAGAAIGTFANVARSFDLVSALMMQDGAVMAQDGTVTMGAFPPGLEGRDMPPADEALTFYTDFAYPAKEVYTWNDEMPNSLEAFINGQTAYFFGYAYNLRDIKARGAKLNFSYTKLPQIGGNQEINYANYWVEGVSKKSSVSNWAWDFVRFATSADQVKSYLDKVEKPTALRALIPYQKDKETLAPFADQLLTAQSWYRGKDPAAAEGAFQEMINSVVKSEMTVREAVSLCAGKIQQTM